MRTSIAILSLLGLTAATSIEKPVNIKMLAEAAATIERKINDEHYWAAGTRD